MAGAINAVHDEMREQGSAYQHACRSWKGSLGGQDLVEEVGLQPSGPPCLRVLRLQSAHPECLSCSDLQKWWITFQFLPQSGPLE